VILVNTAVRFRDEFLIIKRYTNARLGPTLLYFITSVGSLARVEVSHRGISQRYSVPEKQNGSFTR